MKSVIYFFKRWLPAVFLVGITFIFLWLMNIRVTPLFMTKVYTLSAEDECSFYNKPDGEEVLVYYLEDTHGRERVEIERRPGERWLDFETADILKVKGNWAMIDLKDGGEPLYIRSEFALPEEVPFFKGRDFMNAKNVPPTSWMFILGALLYFVLLFPIYKIFKGDVSLEDKSIQLLIAPIAYAFGLFLVLNLFLKFVIGYNLTANWPVNPLWFDSWYMPILNGIVLLAGTIIHLLVLLNVYVEVIQSSSQKLKKGTVLNFLFANASVYIILLTCSFMIVVALVIIAVIVFLHFIPMVFSLIMHSRPSSSQTFFDVNGKELENMGGDVYRSYEGNEYRRVGTRFERCDHPGDFMDVPGQENR